MNGATIFHFLLQENLDFKSFDWLKNGTLNEFEILVSVVLTQNTNWKNVLKALVNVKAANITTLEHIERLPNADLALLIKPSGFYNTKAKRIKALSSAILKDFQNLENFKKNVSRQWLLNVKGLGYESVDSILNYLCEREILVVDTYTQRLALALGYEFENYEDLREFFQSGVENEQEKLCERLDCKMELYELYQIFHALILTFCKEYFKGKCISEKGKEILQKLKA
ncbi:3-methyladenine DNA glycosylase [Campylobacter sp. MIT 21-1685]|uniref:3-methyladenine DNA glycosylase n=1 Tax=unclassified Campylobacter TaxID=2593542 RepID=UPI00224B8438|nr:MULTISPECIES: 3-methyladenine DNA glycosylase [unclassified Campylobacter]MCX2682399.1 3-methyladenine DNA glycosylase [Campylobacter sp. MIT 21-1684]MCX2750679.1 3-methyladenine DNA glycosylase [Campylobacter sp. MIT 21-1682]MCX2806773.1 3-methyladenine DNA glycosylase [Campylobacter sp. MIT 21-1685]